MTDAKTILQMIEEVNPGDEAKLDEIDARVACYLNTTYEQNFISMCTRGNGVGFVFDYVDLKGERGRRDQNLCVRYTRSRDWLKKIRPEWDIKIFNWGYTNKKAVCDIANGKGVGFTSGIQQTEELAELHAIIQSIEWERGRG